VKCSFSTLGCPDWTIDEIMEKGSAYGYDGVELRTNADGNHFSPDRSPAEARTTGQRFRDAGLPVISVMGYSTFAHSDSAQVAENVALLSKLVDLAEAFGAPFVRTFAGQIPKGTDSRAMTDTVAAALKEPARKAADKGIRIGLETHDDWCSGARVMSVVRQVDSRGFGIVYDIFNAIQSGIEPWDVTYGKVREQICYCHLKDAYKGPDGRIRYVMLGAGDLPLADVLGRMKAGGFGGFFSFEWEKKWFPDLEPPEQAFPQFIHKLRRSWGSV